MRAEHISNTIFQGQVIKTGNHFSAKPKQCLENTEEKINDLIKSKHYDLYIHQDYSTNEIVFGTDNISISKRIPVTSKASKYIETAKNVIDEHEKAASAENEARWEKEQNKAEVRDIFLSLFYIAALPFIVMAVELKEESKNLKTTFNKLAKQIATKKG